MNMNIPYQTPNIANFYSKQRVKFDQFYDSEKLAIRKLDLRTSDKVLDIGCGCGGLGLALFDQFGITEYTGVEINELAVLEARRMNHRATVHHGDFLKISNTLILGEKFDRVFSLSCIDWNIQFDEMLFTAWNHVANGGSLVATFRLASPERIDKQFESFQYINFEGKLSGEKAPYLVFNLQELLEKLTGLFPSSISANGYFGSPSKTAVTPYKKICFAAFIMTKGIGQQVQKPHLDLQIPEELLLQMNKII